VPGSLKLRLVSITLAAAMLASVLVLFSLPDHDGARTAVARARPAMLAHAEVTIESRSRLMHVPRSFVGLSTEYWDVPLLERRLAAFERVLSLLHVPGDGRLVFRIGGDSADHSFWGLQARSVPSWVFRLTSAWLRQTSILLRRADLGLILDLNLVTGSPSLAARWAAAAQRRLPHGSIVGYEIGNEPDIYSRRYWLATVSRTGVAARALPSTLTAASYTQDFRSYAAALAQVAPRVPLIGPAVANPVRDMGWIRNLIAAAGPALGAVSAHRYPFSACVSRRSPSYPTIARLLDNRASAGLADSLRKAVAVAHSDGLPFRLTELNSVTCGGRPGVSDSFASALWAPDALFELLRAGVDGVNVHVRENAINAAFTLTRHGLLARPLLYGLILFVRALGTDGQLVDLHVHVHERALGLKVWAVRAASGSLHVLLIDKGDRPISIELRLPTIGAATVDRLQAPSVRSLSGITLDGRRLGTDGRWRGPAADERIWPDGGGYALTLPRMSAALVDAHLRAGALALKPRTPTHSGSRSRS
jgi:hypothetical protein